MNSRPPPPTVTPTAQIQQALDVKENNPPPQPSAAQLQQVGGDEKAAGRGTKNKSSYFENQIVWYVRKKHDQTTNFKARILKIHLDDELVPYYDICLLDEGDGNSGSKERQTTDDHLQPIQADDNDHQHGIMTTNDEVEDGFVHVPSLTPAGCSSSKNPFEATAMANLEAAAPTMTPGNPFDAFDDLLVVDDNKAAAQPRKPEQPQKVLLSTPDLLSTSPTTSQPPTTAGISSQNDQDLLLLDGFEPILSPVPTTVTTSTTTVDSDPGIIVDTGSTTASNTTSRNTGNPFDAFDPLFNGNSVNISNNNNTNRLSEDVMTMSSMSSASLSLLDDYVEEQQRDATFDKQSYSCSDLLFDKYDDTEEEGDDDDEDFGFEIMGSPPVKNSNSLYNPWLRTSTYDNSDSDEEANRHSLAMLSDFKSPPLLNPRSGATSISDDERAKKDYSRKKKKKKKKLASRIKKSASSSNKQKKTKGVNSKVQTQSQQQQEQQSKQELSVGQDNLIDNTVDQVTGEFLRVEIVKTATDKKEPMVTGITASQEQVEEQPEDGVPTMPLAGNAAENEGKPANEGHGGDDSTGNSATKKLRSPSKQKKKRLASTTIQMPLSEANSPAQSTKELQNVKQKVIADLDEDTPDEVGRDKLSSQVSTRRNLR